MISYLLCISFGYTWNISHMTLYMVYTYTFWHGTRHFGWLLISDLCNGAMCYMIKAWWIRRWYFLYISAFIVLYIVALYKPLGQHMKHFIHKHDIVLQITYFIQIHFYLVIHLTMHYHFIIIWFSLIFTWFYKGKHFTRFMTTFY